jgi:hypothetical protein
MPPSVRARTLCPLDRGPETSRPTKGHPRAIVAIYRTKGRTSRSEGAKLSDDIVWCAHEPALGMDSHARGQTFPRGIAARRDGSHDIQVGPLNHIAEKEDRISPKSGQPATAEGGLVGGCTGDRGA